MARNIELGVRLTADGKGFVGAVTVSDKAVRKGLSPCVRWNCQNDPMRRSTKLGCAVA